MRINPSIKQKVFLGEGIIKGYNKASFHPTFESVI